MSGSLITKMSAMQNRLIVLEQQLMVAFQLITELDKRTERLDEKVEDVEARPRVLPKKTTRPPVDKSQILEVLKNAEDG